MPDTEDERAPHADSFDSFDIYPSRTRRCLNWLLLWLMVAGQAAALLATTDVLAATPKIAARAYHNLARKSDGTLWGWANNANGQLGDGSPMSRLSPVQMGSGYSVAAADHSKAAFEAASNSWTTKASMPTTRQRPIAGVVNGRLYVAGGLNLSTTLGTLEAYDPATNAWTISLTRYRDI